jgi:radical SAM superfamily enzyme YgiQ (UPF0313 family)
MDILLVNAPVTNRSRHARLSPPLGLAYIGAVLLQHEYSVTAEDCNLTDFNATRMRRLLEDREPRIVGISASTETYPNALRIAAMAKDVDPSVTVVVGGPHASVMHRDVAGRRDVDIVVRGEGEYTMLALADCLLGGHGTLGEVTGITYTSNGDVIVAPDRPFILNPDELPTPARGLFPLPMYDRAMSVLMSRGGCPCDCAFCAVNNIWQGGRRFRSAGNVVQEIVELIRTEACDEINFADDTFTLSRKHVVKLCEAFAEAGDVARCEWRCTTRVDMVDRELLEIMREAGCGSITFGVESGSQRILDAIDKRITREQVLEAVTTALELGMDVLCSFMFPHPDDTEDTVAEQKAFMDRLVELGATVSLALTTPFPGTPYYENADALGIRMLTTRWDEFDGKHLVIATRYLSDVRLRALLSDLIQAVGMHTDSVAAYGS